MQQEKRFYKNLELWSQVNPRAAVFLPYLDCEHFHFTKTKNDELNLKQIIDGHAVYYHANSGAAQESQKWFSSLSLDDIDVLYVYGVGLGFDYLAAKAWLKQRRNRRLIFLEDELPVIHRLFETDLGSKILRDRQVLLHYFDNIDEETKALKALYWSSISTKLCITALRSYAKRKKEIFKELQHKITYDAAMQHEFLDEYLTYGIPFFSNFYPNMLSLPGAYLGDSLFDKFRDVPAIICGAGPSLAKQLSALASLSDRALIFAGGSTMNALNSAGLQSHFGAGIDPNAEQLKRLASNTAYDVPFFYRNRMYHPALKMIRGPRLYITGSGGYDISRYFEEKFQISGGDLDEGHNVINFCIEIARMMGCNPIIFIGLDLAYTDMQAYAPGIEDEKNQLKQAELSDVALLRKDIHGQQIYTMWKWIAEANWIGDFAKEHPEMTLINATEGGIGLPDVTNVLFVDAINQHLNEQYSLKDRLQSEIQNAALPQVTVEVVVEAMKELRDSLVRCQGNLEVLIEETKNLVQQIKQNKGLPTTLQSGKAALAEIELAEESGYIYVLDIFNVVYSKVLSGELQRINTSRNMVEWRKVIQRLLLNNKKLKFLHDAASANIYLIQHAFENYKV